MTRITTLLVLLVSSLSVVYGQEGRCMGQLFDKVLGCFTENGLDLNVEPGQQDATRLMQETQAMDPSIQCQNKEVYKAAISCALTALGECLVEVGMGGAIPNTQQFKMGMDRVCERQADFDNDCLKNNYRNILQCGEDTVKAVVQENNSEMNMNDIICMSADVNYDCARKYLQTCDKDTMDIYLEQLDKYQVPSACLSKRPGRPGRRNYTTLTSSSNRNSFSTVFVSFAAVASLALNAFYV